MIIFYNVYQITLNMNCKQNNIIQMKNEKSWMLSVQIDQESDNDSDDNKNKMKKYAVTKFESRTLAPGLFLQGVEDINYIFTEKKQQTKQNQVIAQNNPALYRSSHLLHQVQFQSSQQDNQKCHEYVKQIQKQVDIQGKHTSQGFTISPQSSKQLLHIFFDESDQQQDIPTAKHNLKSQAQKIEILTYSDINIYPDQIHNIRQFMRKEIPKGKKVELTISRDKSGFNYIWPEFSLIFNENGKTLAFAKKMMGSSTSNYYITIEKGLQDVENDNFLSKVRSNFIGSSINIFSHGLNPLKFTNAKIARQIRATIKYNGQLLPKKPRQFQVFIIKDQYKYSDLSGLSKDQQLGLDILYNKEDNKNKIQVFRNRKPIYSEQLKAFILNFGGRVRKPSIKNFILQSSEESREVMMLGKVGQDIFKMQACYPFKPYIAFGISLAHFDSKYTGQ